MNTSLSIVFRVLLCCLSLGTLTAFSVPAHAVVLSVNSHWDGTWNLTTGIITGNFVVDILPFPMLTATVDLSTSSGTYSGNDGDSIHFTVLGDGPGAVPPFGGFTGYSGSFTIDGGTGHYSGAVGGGRYFAHSIPDPTDSNILKHAVFQTGSVNAVPEPASNALLLVGVGILVLALRGRRAYRETPQVS